MEVRGSIISLLEKLAKLDERVRIVAKKVGQNVTCALKEDGPPNLKSGADKKQRPGNWPKEVGS